jgi:hypothetical protein
MDMKRLPIGIQTFSKLRDPAMDYVYVDKTREILELVSNGVYFFLSRPRRFGKSVMLSTLHELFSGNLDLFRGLYIEDRWDWEKKHPVIRISFGSGDFASEEKFDRMIHRILERNQRRLGIACRAGIEDPGSCLEELIETAWRNYGQKAVILIDEYDKPILDHITDRDRARFNRDKLKGFYSIIKDLDEFIRFVMITGVSKFSKMNLFSGLNNLEDITIDSKFATLCGYTHEEVKQYFSEHLQGVDLEKLKEWYNGYNYFGQPVYNPFDILLFFAKDKEYRPYWWSTGNPSFLIDILKEQPRYLPDLENCMVDDLILDTFDVDHIDIAALLWQTGYLTFAEKWEAIDGTVYRLKVPNREIQISLNNLFFNYLTSLSSEVRRLKQDIHRILTAGDLDALRRHLQSIFSSIPYHNYKDGVIQRYEGYYASVVYAYMASLGFQIIAEDTTNKGRVDLTLILPDRIYVMEFKVDQEGKALEQIRQKGYHEKYLNQGKPIYLVGMGFDSEEKNITEFQWVKIPVSGSG